MTAGKDQLAPQQVQQQNLFDLTGRTAVVVGSTSGLGRALAVGLAQHGANVIPSGRREDMLADVCAAVEGVGRKTMCHPVDISARTSIDVFRDAVLRQFGQVDILVNAAGRTSRKPTATVPEDEWTGIIDTNLHGMLRTCQSFYQPLKASGRGRIVNIASLSSFVAFHEVAAYGVSKAGVMALTQSLGCEWCRDGINVNAIVPGVFPTELNSRLLNGTDRGRELIQRTPMKRFGKPEELVGAAVFLASDAASFITGQSIAVDGGFLASGVNS